VFAHSAALCTLLMTSAWDSARAASASESVSPASSAGVRGGEAVKSREVGWERSSIGRSSEKNEWRWRVASTGEGWRVGIGVGEGSDLGSCGAGVEADVPAGAACVVVAGDGDEGEPADVEAAVDAECDGEVVRLTTLVWVCFTSPPGGLEDEKNPEYERLPATLKGATTSLENMASGGTGPSAGWYIGDIPAAEVEMVGCTQAPAP
jgi:hypothetical protein